MLVTAVFLVFFFQSNSEHQFDELLFDHIEELVAESKFDSDGNLYLEWRPLDPRFHTPGSGWYWEIRGKDKVLLRSRSLVDFHLDIVPVLNGKGLRDIRKNGLILSELKNQGSLHIQQIKGPGGDLLRAQLLDILFPTKNQSFWFIVTGPVQEIKENVKQFVIQLIAGCLFLFIGLLIAVFVQVYVALKPLRAMRHRINAIHQGKEKRLLGSFPEEVQIVVNELNTLLDHTEDVLHRARLNIGNLAHTIKNPLAVISNEAKHIEGVRGSLIHKEVLLIESSMDRYLTQARFAAKANLLGSRSDVNKTVKDILFTMEKLYRDKSIHFHLSEQENCWFPGEAEDLEEMLGNLMDNACKWTVDRVWVRVQTNKNQLRIVVEDNGPGIPQEKMEEVLQLGIKLDESAAGHGLGLHIVDQIVELYGGSIILQPSTHGGLCAVLELPAA